MPAVSAFALVAAIALTGGCFTHPINRAPIVRSVDLVGTLGRAEKASFIATADDPDGDAIDFFWAVRHDACLPTMGDPSSWPPGSPASTFLVDETFTTGPFCVWAFATDRYGAVGAKAVTFTPRDRPPVASIELTQPETSARYRLYTTFRLDGNGSMDPDGDALDASGYAWSLRKPTGSSAELGPCDGNTSPAVRCFQADRGGLYAASLTVTTASTSTMNGIQSAPQSLSFDVLEDTLPCIELTMPSHDTTFVSLSPQVPQDFVVRTVSDDGDPYPQTQGITFTWFQSPPETPPGTLPVAQNVTLSRLTIDKEAYKIGDTTVVRVEVRDRHPEAVDESLRTCGDASPVCWTTDPLDNSKCFQRVSWTVNWQ